MPDDTPAHVYRRHGAYGRDGEIEETQSVLKIVSQSYVEMGGQNMRIVFLITSAGSRAIPACIEGRTNRGCIAQIDVLQKSGTR